MKRTIRVRALWFLLFPLGFVPACTNPSLPAPNGSTSVTLTVPAASQAYLVFTNESETENSSGAARLVSASAPTISRSVQGQANPAFTAVDSRRGKAQPPDQIMQAGDRLSRNLATSPKSAGRSLAPSPPNADSTPTVGAVGIAGSYIVADPNTSVLSTIVPVHLRYKSASPVAGRTLYVWVADNCWDASNPNSGSASGYTYISGTAEPFLVNTSQVNALAAKFLSDGIHDIYGLDTGLYGVEWPDLGQPAPASGLITPQGEIHIYILDLNPSATGNNKGNGGSMGYFWNLDNFTNSLYSGSNQKIMFQLDAENFGNPALDGIPGHGPATAWSLSGGSSWPNEIVSTLAHEFQHMIHFYQKQVLRNANGPTDTWINEMCSMVTEDFVAASIGTVGPRGVPYTSPPPYSVAAFNFGPGTLGTTAKDNDLGSRQAIANYYHDTVSLMDWNNTNSLPNYGLAFSFGAWLARNYGGPSLFHAIVDSQFTDKSAILNAIFTVRGVTRTMPQLVEEWNAALISQSTAFPTTISGNIYHDATGPYAGYSYGSFSALDYYQTNVTSNPPIVTPQGGPTIASLSSLSVLGPLQFQYLQVTPNNHYSLVLPKNIGVQVVTIP